MLLFKKKNEQKARKQFGYTKLLCKLKIHKEIGGVKNFTR